MAPSHDTVLSVVDLLDQPGASRRVDLTFDPPAGLDLPLTDAVGPLHLRGVLESVVDGVLVRGDLATDLTMQCARCLVPVEVEVDADVAELFADPGRVPPGDEVEPGYTIREGRIDVDTLLRDTLAPAVPLAPLHDAGCRGLCATCGQDLNAAPDHPHDQLSDPRWAALTALRVERDGE